MAKISYRVRVAAGTLLIPASSCCCCMKTAETQKAFEQRYAGALMRILTFNVPFCLECLRHERNQRLTFITFILFWLWATMSCLFLVVGTVLALSGDTSIVAGSGGIRFLLPL